MRLLTLAPLSCALALFAALVAGCGGNGGASATVDPATARAGFKEAVASGLKRAGFEAEGGFGLKVFVQDGPDWMNVLLDEPFEEYRRNEARRQELVALVVRETREHFRRGNDGLSFAEVENSLMPVLKAGFALRRIEPEPAATPAIAHLSLIFAVQTENAFTVVSAADADRWGRPPEELRRIALANLLRQTNREQKLLCEPSGGEELCGWASGDGYDATRMLVPELRNQIEKEYGEPAVYAVPMENVFVALPLRLAESENTEKLLRTKVERDFATSKAPVSPELFVERRGKLVVFRP